MLFYFFILFTGSLKLMAQEKVHVISLKAENILTQDFYISEVLDDRSIKDNIGVAQKGLMNKQVPANFNENFTTHLQNYLNAILPEKPAAEPLTLKVHKLYISERTSAMSELGTCEVELEFLKNKNGQLYSLGNYSSAIEGKGADVTGKHDERIQEALQNCIAKFSETNWKSQDLAEVNSKESSGENSFNQNLPLIKGLYFDFDDLVNNSPKQDLPYREKKIAQTKKIEHFQIFESNKNKRIKNLFGYSDGENIYLHASRYAPLDYFIKSKLIGRYIYFEDEFSSAAATASLGLIGALATIRYSGIVLDTKTGITTILNNANMEKILGDYPALMAEYNLTKKKVEDDRTMIEKINALQKS